VSRASCCVRPRAAAESPSGSPASRSAAAVGPRVRARSSAALTRLRVRRRRGDPSRRGRDHADPPACVAGARASPTLPAERLAAVDERRTRRDRHRRGRVPGLESRPRSRGSGSASRRRRQLLPASPLNCPYHAVRKWSSRRACPLPRGSRERHGEGMTSIRRAAARVPEARPAQGLASLPPICSTSRLGPATSLPGVLAIVALPSRAGAATLTRPRAPGCVSVGLVAFVRGRSHARRQPGRTGAT
jgi:hypothetical protein